MEMEIGPGAQWFEDLAIGQQFRTTGRTITETDMVMFCMFSGDMNPLHTDEEFARENGPFGGRIPQGFTTVAIASGLMERLGLFQGTGRGLLEQTIRWRRPVKLGDTIHVVLTVDELTDRDDRPWGTVRMGYEITTGDGTIAIEGHQVVLVANREH